MVGCQHAMVKPNSLVPPNETVSLIKKDVTMVFVPEHQRVPPHIIYQRRDRYAFGSQMHSIPFKLEMTINPLMRNVTLVAQVEKNGKVVREFVANKSASSQLNDKKTAWLPARSKLAFAIPYIAANEEVVVTTSYEWMDIRWLSPILMQENGPVPETRLTVDVPYGITMHFKAAKNRTSLDFVPNSFPHEKALWVQDGNRAGLGTRYVFSAQPEYQSASSLRADLLQVFLSFETPMQSDGGLKFDNWGAVASYLYDRIERYDMPSNEIRDFAIKETKDKTSDEQKIARVFAFLRNEVEKRAMVSAYQDQDVQPATRTFARRFGTPFDIAILGKAMLLSIGYNTDLVAVADKRYNPELPDFFSPALFSSIILAVATPARTFYFDPEGTKDRSDQLRPSLQGQGALVIKPKNGAFFSMPFDNAQKNTKIHSYQLSMSEDGMIEGDYSVDLTGLEAHSVSEFSLDQLKTMAPDVVETKLLGGSDPPFSIDTFDITREHPLDLGVRIFGEIKPRLLPKNAHGDFELNLDKIIRPAIGALKEASSRDYSSVTKISLFISLPDDFVATDLPKNVYLHIDGIDGRFSAFYADGQIVVEGLTMISLPVKKGFDETLKTELDGLKLFGEQKMVIHDRATITGASDGDQQPANAENS